ncbi:uncharacterized protein LOC114530108 [Dendronephthya gigantea]|uniref:uncharacterized protein LOC114530108 n=1 Tax=Dendronephthya gigantea TaxID=151771 RepID=UPI00106AC76C|nr:uncharacterized protein LOC114530108 [Dendronephthya gigantea]
MEEVELPPEQSPLYQEPRYPDFEVFSEIEEEEYVIPPTSQKETVEVHGEPKTPSQNPGDADFHENKLGDPQSNSKDMDEDQYPEYENMENNSLPAIAMTPLNSTKDHPHE